MVNPSERAGEAGSGDGAVVRRVLAGDVEAFRILVERYRREFGRYAVAQLGDADAAADAMQSAFIRAWDSLASCRDPDRFGAWFFRILTNQCHTARSRRREYVALEPADFEGRDRPDTDLDRAELGAALEAAMARLTPEQRDAFIMRHVDGRSYEEMAALLDAGVDALKMRVYRAREALKSMIEVPR